MNSFKVCSNGVFPFMPCRKTIVRLLYRNLSLVNISEVTNLKSSFLFLIESSMMKPAVTDYAMHNCFIKLLQLLISQICACYTQSKTSNKEYYVDFCSRYILDICDIMLLVMFLAIRASSQCLPDEYFQCSTCQQYFNKPLPCGDSPQPGFKQYSVFRISLRRCWVLSWQHALSELVLDQFSFQVALQYLGCFPEI